MANAKWMTVTLTPMSRTPGRKIFFSPLALLFVGVSLLFANQKLEDLVYLVYLV